MDYEVNPCTRTHLLAFVVWVAASLFIQLMMFSASPDTLPAPDLVIITCFIFRFRQGKNIPFFLLFVILLVSDLVSNHLTGLYTLAYFALLEFISLKHKEFKSVGFIGEWFTFTIFLVVSYIFFWVVALDERHTVDTVKLALITLLFYPVVRYSLTWIVFKRHKL